MWRSPEALPDLAELEHPRGWLDRVAVASAAGNGLSTSASRNRCQPRGYKHMFGYLIDSNIVRSKEVRKTNHPPEGTR